MTPLRLGIIGGSYRSAVGQAHVIASQMDQRFQVVAGCFSRSPSINRESARKYGLPINDAYETIEKLLVMGDLDAVAVLTPTPTHYSIVRQCQRHGIPVICEKALAGTSREAADLDSGFLAVTYNYSGYPMIRELRHWIQLGRLGKIHYINAEMPQEGYARTDTNPPQPWRLIDQDIPTVYLDLGVHLHHLIGYLTDRRPLSVFAHEDQHGRYPVIDHVTALVRYEGHLDASLWFGKAALGMRNGLRLRVYGDQGSAEWLQEDPEHLLLCNAQGKREILDRASPDALTAGLSLTSRFKAGHPAGFIEAFANLYGDIAQALHHYQETGNWFSQEVKSASFAAEGLSLMEAMTASAQTGQSRIVPSWFTLTDTPRRSLTCEA